MRPKNRGGQDLRLQLLALYLLFVVPIFVLALFFFYNASQRLRADVAVADLSLVRAIALETDSMLLKAKDAVVAFAQVPAVIQADPADMEAAFTAGTAARQDINLFYRVSADGIMLYHYPPGPGQLWAVISPFGTISKQFDPLTSMFSPRAASHRQRNVP
jgi:hypothetical protein